MDAPNGIIRSSKESSARDLKVVISSRPAAIVGLGIASGRENVKTNVDNKATHSTQAHTIEFMGVAGRMVTEEIVKMKEPWNYSAKTQEPQEPQPL
jgi:hypothetical protein